ncbi:TMV resistance protein N, partial [Trifolium medium]|nr:TMV resistance protein N [Trifolium medium]
MSPFTSSFSSSSKRKRDISMEGETSQLEDDKFISWLSSPYPRHNYGNETEHIENEVECTTVIREKRVMFNDLYTESLNSRVQDVIQILKQSKCPLLVGIWGMTGIGKTAIASVIYDQIGPYFEDTCFLEDVSSLVKFKNETLASLQEKFLLDIGKATEINISTIESGKVILKERLRNKRVVACSGGLPFALLVFGIDFGIFERTVDAWKSKLDKLKELPEARVQKILEGRVNDLSDEEKQIFLHIAYLLIGRNQDDVLQALNRSTPSAALQISLLEDKCFLTIDENNKLQVHVLLQATAKYIIERKSRYHTYHQPKLYDVFLSFRAEDSRAKFMPHLYSSLQNAGIYAFRDNDEIQRGDQISISLLRAIRQSKIAIVILSTNYANSRCCLEELAKIMEIGRTRELVVVPVYEVDRFE